MTLLLQALRTSLVLATLFAVAVMFAQSTLAVPTIDVSGHEDLMVYSLLVSGSKSLMLYDAQKDISSPIFVDTDFGTFRLKPDGTLAVALLNKGQRDVYLLNVLSDNPSPVNITQTNGADEHPLAWSPDGRYLAFQSFSSGENPQIFVLDSNTATPINITPDDVGVNVDYYRVSWSFDGRLAFTVWYDYRSSQQSEIYLWDGSTTMNLSQNPTGEDDGATWSADGRVAFLSHRNGNYDVYIWDGKSLRNDLPDIDTYINVAPELTMYMSSPAWSNKGYLAFIAFGSKNRHSQIYLWDNGTAINITQNPSLHNGLAQWTLDGRWAFATFFSREQRIYVRDAANHTLLTVEGQYPPAWSKSGHLAFCHGGWTLSVWDGKQTRKVANGGEIYAQWDNGSYVVCSSG